MNKKKVVHGTIYKFLNIDPSAPWLDLNERKTKKYDEESGEILPVAAHMKPNCMEFGYIFYPEEHRFFFECNKMSPGSMRNLLSALFSNTKIAKEFGEVDIDIESTKEAINRILSIPKMTRLEIIFRRQNDDLLEGAREKVAKRLERQGIRRLNQVATTTDDEGIKPDEETKALMDLARSNGKVIGIGYDGEQKMVRSTEYHPLKDSEMYSPGFDNRLDVMARISTAMISRIKT